MDRPELAREVSSVSKGLESLQHAADMSADLLSQLQVLANTSRMKSRIPERQQRVQRMQSDFKDVSRTLVVVLCSVRKTLGEKKMSLGKLFSLSIKASSMKRSGGDSFSCPPEFEATLKEVADGLKVSYLTEETEGHLDKMMAQYKSLQDDMTEERTAIEDDIKLMELEKQDSVQLQEEMEKKREILKEAQGKAIRWSCYLAAGALACGCVLACPLLAPLVVGEGVAMVLCGTGAVAAGAFSIHAGMQATAANKEVDAARSEVRRLEKAINEDKRLKEEMTQHILFMKNVLERMTAFKEKLREASNSVAVLKGILGELNVMKKANEDMVNEAQAMFHYLASHDIITRIHSELWKIDEAYQRCQELHETGLTALNRANVRVSKPVALGSDAVTVDASEVQKAVMGPLNSWDACDACCQGIPKALLGLIATKIKSHYEFTLINASSKTVKICVSDDPTQINASSYMALTQGVEPEGKVVEYTLIPGDYRIITRNSAHVYINAGVEYWAWRAEKAYYSMFWEKHMLAWEYGSRGHVMCSRLVDYQKQHKLKWDLDDVPMSASEMEKLGVVAKKRLG